MIILQTQRLFLRTTKLEDIQTLYDEIFSIKDIVKHTFGKELFDLKQTQKFIKQNCNFDDKIGLSTLVEKQTNAIIGLSGVLKCKYLGQDDFEFGFILSKKYWGKGYATEIGKAQIDFVKYQLKSKRVLALASPQNTASIHTIEKLGLTYVKTIKLKDRDDRDVFTLDFED